MVVCLANIELKGAQREEIAKWFEIRPQNVPGETQKGN
jgi:hypothetical protein